MSKYEIQEVCLCGGWTNTWSHEDDDGNSIPTIYDSIEEAEIDLEDFFEDCDYAVKEEFLEDMPSREDYRIVEVKNVV